MDAHGINLFLSGSTMMASLVCALYFLRFWRKTGDRLFVLFAVAFLLLGTNRLGVALSTGDEAPHPGYYVVRLLAFLLIIIAIVDKNRGSARTAR